MKYLLIAITALGLCACAPKQVLPEDSSNALQGKSRAEILECLGPPAKQAEVDGITFWSYKYEDVARAATWNCELRLKIANGRVTKTDIHTTVENIFGASKSLCIEAANKCK